jgi:hypothetical protein
MAAVHGSFEIQGVQYTGIHFKAAPLARDLILRRFRDRVEISRFAYQEAKAEYTKLRAAARGA